MFHFGFSYIGLIYLLMLFIPNGLWTAHKPKGYDEYVKNENKLLLLFERTGEVLTCACVLIFSDFNIRKTYWAIWLVISFFFMLMYEIYWVRYFKSSHEMKDFYSSFCGIPVAGATLPVIAFFLLGIYGSNAFLLVSVLILGIGHIGIHLQHKREVCGKVKKKLPVRILGWIGGTILGVLAACFVIAIGCRNANYIQHYSLVKKGVDEGVYIELGGQEQYVLMRGNDAENPVMIYLHGGPSSADTYATYGFSKYLTDDYTVLAWDQRGCGRTYFRNSDKDPENTTATFAQALTDLDELVDYACERFGQEKVIIVGHSYGTILGSEYALAYPDKVSAYVSVAQVVSLEKMVVYSYEDALKKAEAAGDDTKELVAAYETFCESEDFTDMMKVRSLGSKYQPAEVADQATLISVISPYFGMDDFRWFLKQLGSLDAYFAMNRPLFDYTYEVDAYENAMNYEMPVYFVSGASDWICPVESVREYAEKITAPEVRLELLDGCGHNVQYSLPEEFAGMVRKMLE